MTVTNLTPPTISGTAQRGETLSSTTGTWDYDLDYLGFTYQWLRCDAAGSNCTDIVGGQESSYLLTAADVGSRIRLEVTATEYADPPPPVGDVLYHHTYTGAQAIAPVYGWDYGFLREGSSTAQIITDGLATGVPAMRATLLPTSNNIHVEGQKKWDNWSVNETRFFGLQFKLPLNWQNPNLDGWGAAIAQLYYPVCVNHNWGLFLHSDHCRFVLLSGATTINPVTREYNNADGAAQGPSPRAIPVGRLTKGVLHTLIAEIKASFDPIGVTRIWHRIATDPGSPALQASYQQTVNVTGIPTLQYGQCYDGTTWPKNSLGPVAGRYIHQKFGFYTGRANHTRVFDSGNYVIGTTFDAVAAEMA